MNSRLARLLGFNFLLLDLFLLNLVFFLVRWYYGSFIATDYEWQYAYLTIVLNIAWIVPAWLIGLYGWESLMGFERFARNSSAVFVYFGFSVILYLFLFKQVGISRLFIISVLSVSFFTLLVSRVLHLWCFAFLQRRDYLIRKVLIIGYNTASKKLARYLEEQPVRTQILGFCDVEDNINELTHYPFLGSITDALKISLQFQATDIYSTISPVQNKELYSLIETADQSCIRLKFVPNMELFFKAPMHMDYLGQMPVFTVRKEPLDDLANRIKKRAIDIVFSILVIVLLMSWLVPILSLLIFLDSRGPVFFMQKRSGVNNKAFYCIKFRTMKVNREADQTQATQGDKRVTRLGRFLRRTSLDELPQFFNVLMSDMSVIGPRPHMLKHTDDFSKQVNHYMVRQFLKPGISGWAQVNGYRGETRTVEDIRGRVECDLWYLENWSVWLDFKIIVYTVTNVFRGEKNAY